MQSSIESQDWESATRQCARAMSLPIEVISGPFAETAVVRNIYSCCNNEPHWHTLSQLPKAISLLHRHYKPRESNSCRYFNITSNKRLVHAMLRLLVDFSNYFPLLDGKPKVWKLTLLL